MVKITSNFPKLIIILITFEVPLTEKLKPITFDVPLTEKLKLFYMVISTWFFTGVLVKIF